MRSALAAILRYASATSAGVCPCACASPSGPPSSVEVPSPREASIASLTFLDDFDIETGSTLDGLELGGLSGLWIEPESGHGFAVSDGHGEHGPPRFYSLEIALTGGELCVTPNAHVAYDTGPTPKPRMDAEGIAWSRTGELFISSEGKPRASPPLPPSIVRVRPSGALTGTLPIPAKLAPDSPQTQGVRHNRGLEALSISPQGDVLFTATEHALLQDGPGPTFEHGTRCRILRYELGAASPGLPSEYVYVTDPIPRPRRRGEVEAHDVGLVELLALSDERLLVLERAGVEVGSRYSNAIRLYEVDIRGAEDVAAQDPLRTSARPLPKRLVLAIDPIQSRRDARFPALDNFEGMSFGPRLPDGRRTLILVSDNNFKATQRTAFFAFAIDE